MKRIALACFFILIFSGTAIAQETLPEQPHAQSNRRWFQSPKFWTAFAVDLAADAADTQTSLIAQHQGNIEADPIYGKHPGQLRFYVEGNAINFAYAYLGYRMSKSRYALVRSLWFVPSAKDAFTHATAAYGNLQLPSTLQPLPPPRKKHHPQW